MRQAGAGECELMAFLGKIRGGLGELLLASDSM
jgi:hypothetical protein